MTAGVNTFVVRDEHCLIALDDGGADVFLTTRSQHRFKPAGWTPPGAGRVCALTPGHNPGFGCIRVSKLLLNAMRWTAKLDHHEPDSQSHPPGFFRPELRVRGEDYYLAEFHLQWFPGVALHHSRDLANWRFVSHALTRKSQLDLSGIGDSAGVWAPSLSYADGQFWLIYTNIRYFGMGRPFKDIGIYLTTAKDIAGPWSEPVTLNSIGFDPSLFHDDDGRKWLGEHALGFSQRQVSLRGDRRAGI